MIFNLPYKTNFSVNSMYRVTRQGKYLKRTAINLRTKIIKDVQEHCGNLSETMLDKDTKLSVSIIFIENWDCKNGEIRRADLDNRLKFLIDSVFTALDLDDKMIYELYAKKGESELEEGTIITINELEEEY